LLLSKKVTKNALLLLTMVPTTCLRSPSRMKILLLSRTTLASFNDEASVEDEALTDHEKEAADSNE
jgi:hypothetical protein